MVNVSSILTMASMNNRNFKHKAMVTVSNVAIYSLLSAVSLALVGAVGVAIVSALNLAPKFTYNLDIILGGGI